MLLLKQLLRSSVPQLPVLFRSSSSLPSQSSPRMTSSHLVWVDMEMTGLDYKKDKILEVACIVTDKDLKILDKGVEYIVHQPDEILNNMNEWCIDHHGKTGLTAASRNSQLTIEQVEKELLSYISQFVKPKDSPMAGNSVYMDRLFMREFMPELNEFLHYRLVDVSTIKELSRRWNPKVFWNAPKKRLMHRALEDIQDSIGELKYYQANIFRAPEADQ